MIKEVAAETQRKRAAERDRDSLQRQLQAQRRAFKRKIRGLQENLERLTDIVKAQAEKEAASAPSIGGADVARKGKGKGRQGAPPTLRGQLARLLRRERRPRPRRGGRSGEGWPRSGVDDRGQHGGPFGRGEGGREGG